MVFGSSNLGNAVFIVFITGGYGYLPDTSQEGILRPYRSYSDVTMFHYNVPPETQRATWQFAAFSDNPDCPPKQVYIYLQHGSYPLVNASTWNFPPNAFIERTSSHLITTQSSFEPRNPTVLPVYNPLPGNWYAAAYVLNWDKQVKQEGISRKCHYSLGSVSLWSRVKDVIIVGTGGSKEVYSTGTYSYYKFYIPACTWKFSLKISNCRHSVSSLNGKTVDSAAQFCIMNLAISAKALPSAHQKEFVSNITEGNGHTFVITEPYSECYYYLLVESEARISFNLEVIVEECRYEMLLRNDFKKVDRVEQLFTSATRFTAKRDYETDQHSTIKYSMKRMAPSGQKPLAHATQEKCPAVFHFMRIKHSENFAITFLLEGDGWSANRISLSDLFVIYAALEIMPFMDIGGTLSLGISLDDKLLSSMKQLVVASVCIKKGAAPEVVNGNISCSPALKMTVTSTNVSQSEAKKLIPFPEPGTWFFAFQLACFTNGSIAPCASSAPLKLDFQLNRCVFPVDSCGSYGICRETHKGLHHFTACLCLGGYKGWGCTDGRNAVDHSILLMNTLLLTLSNVFFIPAIVLAVRQRMMSEALVYFATMTFSMLYHACDEDFYSYCATKYEVLQFCDFFCSIFSFWVTLIATANVPTHLVSAFQVVGVIIIAFGVESNRTGLLVFVIPSALGSLVPLCYWCFRSYKQSRILFHISSFLKILLGVLLAATGLVMFAFVETEANYQYVHSAWHVAIALSLVFLIPPRVTKKTGNYSQSSDSELYDINNCSNTGTVLDVVSDEDSLITS